MKRLVPAAVLALVVGATQPGCICTATGALIGLIVGATSDDPEMDVNDHVRNGALIGLEIDGVILAGISTANVASRGRCEGDRMRELAFVDVGAAGVRETPRTSVIVGPTSCTLACRF